MIESESKYISGDISSTKVKVYLHNVSGNVFIFIGLMKWGNLEIRLTTDSELNTKDLWIRIAALRMRSGSKNNH